MPAINEIPAELAKRYTYCQSGYYASGSSCYPNTPWYWWGRWVLAAIVIVFVIAIFMILGCVNSRRRRRRGLAPRYGTGWMAPANKFGGNTAYPNNGAPYQPPAPPYNAGPVPNQYTGQTYDSNHGYYGPQQTGVQSPPNTYYPAQRGGEDVYQPPPGPPPGKGA